MKKENVACKRLSQKVFIAGRIVEEIFFDLQHIRYGWDQQNRDYQKGDSRNDYTEDDVVAFFEQLNTLLKAPVREKGHFKNVEARYIFYVFDEGKKLKMVVDFMKSKITVVVTLYEMRRK